MRRILLSLISVLAVGLMATAAPAFATITPEGAFSATSEGNATLHSSTLGTTECEATLSGTLTSRPAGKGATGKLEVLENNNCTTIKPELVNEPTIKLEKEVAPNEWDGEIQNIRLKAVVSMSLTCEWEGNLPITYNNAGTVEITSNSLTSTNPTCGSAEAKGSFSVTIGGVAPELS